MRLRLAVALVLARPLVAQCPDGTPPDEPRYLRVMQEARPPAVTP